MRTVTPIALGLFLLAGCTKEDPTYCDENDPCDPGYTCHLPSKTCVPADAGTDLGVLPEASAESGPGLEAGADQTTPPDQGIDGPHCGDGKKNNAEECDGTDLGGETCVSKGFAVGTLTCTQCTLDTSGCHSWVAVPSGTTENLRDVWASAASDVWVVGDGGTVLRYDGTSWSSGPAIPTGIFALRVWGLSTGQVWALSGITVYSLNGSTWTSILEKPVALSGLWASSTSNIVVTAVTQGSDGGLDYKSSQYLFNGLTWTEMPSDPDWMYWGSWGLSASDIWTFGGVIKKSVSSDWAQGTPLLYHFDGVAWTEEKTAAPANGVALDVWGPSSSDVWAVGYGGLILQRKQKLWYPATSPTQKALFGVWGSSASDIWAVGQNGTILHYNGGAWSTVASPTTENLDAVWGTSASDVWAVGDKGTLLRLQ